MEFYEQGLRFACTRCSRCCRHTPGYVFLSANDLARIGEGTGLPEAQVRERFCRTVDPGGFPRLSLKEKPNLDCIFWEGEGCSVYAHRPAAVPQLPLLELQPVLPGRLEAGGRGLPGDRPRAPAPGRGDPPLAGGAPGGGVAVKIHFWGVRGSIPTPLTPEQIKSRISAVVMRIRPMDLGSPESREAFLAALPPYLFGTVGGNTTCLEFRTRDDQMILVDAGSGLRELGASLMRTREKIREFHIFFTHFHWDHLQGIPFFKPLYIPGNRVFFYSPEPDLELILRGQMRQPYFPVGMEVMNAEMNFVQLQGSELRLGDALVQWKPMRHPGGCQAYKLTEDGRSAIFATDSEITSEDFQRTEVNTRFFQGVDLLILDSQYTLGEAIEKYDWGHTSYSLAIDFASEWEIRTLALYHHEPDYSDRKINGILNSAEWYLARLQRRRLKVILAQEGLELQM